MQSLTEQIVNAGLSERVLDEAQLARLAGGSEFRRYGLVNRACKAGELLRLRRGLYVLDQRFRQYPAHPFILAQALVPGSYVSLETALAYHGWIPEAVYSTANIIPGRKSKQYAHEKFGNFNFYPLAIQKGYFLELVLQEHMHGQTMLVAKPARALMDLICLRKIEWQGLDWLTEGLRVDMEQLQTISRDDITALKSVYKQRRVKTFLEEFAGELGHD